MPSESTNYELDEVLIHIGYHKTGTTWLQNNLFTASNDIFEPLSRRNRGPGSLARHFIYGTDGYVLSPFDFNTDNIQQEIQYLLKTKKHLSDKLPVLSHERLSGNPHSSGFDANKIASMLKNSFPNAKILIVIREQKSFILSNYFQYLHIGGTHKLKKYLNTKYDGKRVHFSPNHINFLPLIRKYHNLFGIENVLVLPYEMFNKESSIFVAKLQDFLNKEIKIDREALDAKSNERHHQFAMYHLRHLNYFRFSSSINNYSSLKNNHTKRTSELLFNCFCHILPSSLNESLKRKLKTQISEYVANKYSESNKKLSKLINIDLSKYGY